MTTLAPIDDGQLVRQLHERIRDLEAPTTQRIGEWVLSSKNGLLTAVKPGADPVTLGGNQEVDFAAQIQKTISGELAGYVSSKDLASALGGFTGVANSSTPTILSQVEQWAANLLGIGPAVLALTGLTGTIADLTAWAGGLFSGGALLASALTGAMNTAVTLAGNALSALFNGSGVIASQIAGALNTAITISGNAISSLFNGSGTLASALTGAINTGVTIAGNAISSLFNGSGTLASALTGAINSSVTVAGNAISSLFNGSGLIASQIAGALNTAVTIGGTAASTLFQYLDSAGQFAAAHVTGALNTAITISGNALSALFNGSGLIASQIAGALNTAITISGNAISSLFNSSGVLASIVNGALNTAVTISGNAISSLFNGSGALASVLTGALNTGVTVAGNAISSLFNSSGALASALTGAINTGVTVAGNAISSLFNGSGLIASQIAGALNTAVTIGGTAASTLFQYLDSAGQFAAAHVTGALNTAITLSGNALSALFNGSGLIASQIAGALNTAVTISGNAISSLFNGSGVLGSAINGAINTAATISGNALSALFNSSGVLASALTGAINTGVTVAGNAISSLFNASGLLGSAINGAINTAATISGNALSTLFNGSGILGSAINGAINTAATISGKALSTLFNGSGLIASQIAGALNTAVTISGNTVSSLFDGSGVLASAVPALSSLITGFGSTITDVINAIQRIDTFISHIPGASLITDVSDAINTAVDNLKSAFDYVAHALIGGSGTGNAPGVLAGLGNIPAHNVQIPPNPGSGTIAHSAHAAGTPVTGSATTLSMTFNITPATTDNFLVFRTALTYDQDIDSVVVTAGGAAMALIESNSIAVTGPLSVASQIWALPLINPAASAMAIQIDATSVSNGAILAIQGEADTYNQVASIGSLGATSGTNSTLSHTFVSATGDYVVQEFAVGSLVTETLTAYSKTSQYNPGSTLSSGLYLAMLAGDATGAASVGFTATPSSTAAMAWVSAAVNLIPIPSTPIGSGFRQYRTGTGTVTPASGANALASASFFDTNQYRTSDFTYTSSTNTLTVANAGWYMVTMNYLISSISGTANYQCLIYKNGTLDQYGGGWWSTGGNQPGNFGASFIIYCNAGDTLKPGIQSQGGGVVITGEATGTKTYWSVSLMNRSLA